MKENVVDKLTLLHKETKDALEKIEEEIDFLLGECHYYQGRDEETNAKYRLAYDRKNVLIGRLSALSESIELF